MKHNRLNKRPVEASCEISGSQLAPQAASLLRANPRCRSVDLNHTVSLGKLDRKRVSASYLVALKYPFSSFRLSEGYPFAVASDIR